MIFRAKGGIFATMPTRVDLESFLIFGKSFDDVDQMMFYSEA
jgi:hypothetical protein